MKKDKIVHCSLIILICLILSNVVKAAEVPIYDAHDIKVYYDGKEAERKAIQVSWKEDNDFLKFYREDVVGDYCCNADNWVLEIVSLKPINGITKIEVDMNKLGEEYLKQREKGNILKPYYRSVSWSDVDVLYKYGKAPFSYDDTKKRIMITLDPKKDSRYIYYDDKTKKYEMNIIMGCEVAHPKTVNKPKH